MTISFFSEAAHHPASLWVSIHQTSYTHALLAETGRFGLAVLHQGQGALALGCGTVSGRDCDKGSALAVYRSPAGFPFLRDVLASTACRVRQTTPLGDYTLFIADIVEADVDSRTYRRHLLGRDLTGP